MQDSYCKNGAISAIFTVHENTEVQDSSYRSNIFVKYFSGKTLVRKTDRKLPSEIRMGRGIF